MVLQNEKFFWDKYIEVYDHLNDLFPYKYLINNIINELNIHSSDKILDAGGGTGNITLQILKYSDHVILLDNSEEAINYFLNKNKNCQTVKYDLRNKLPFKDDYFDKIVCNNTLYILEVKFYDKILKEFYRILKKNGKLVLSNPVKGAIPLKILIAHFKILIKKGNFFTLFKDLFIKIKYLFLILYYNNKIKNKKEYHFFDIEEQEELLSKNNFIIEKSFKAYSNQNILTVAIKK